MSTALGRIIKVTEAPKPTLGEAMGALGQSVAGDVLLELAKRGGRS